MVSKITRIVLFNTFKCFSAFYNDSGCFCKLPFYPSKYYFITFSASPTVLPMPSQLDRGADNLECGTDSIAALGQSEETANDCEEQELDSIEKIKADLPKNIIKNMDDLAFIQPDVNSM